MTILDLIKAKGPATAADLRGKLTKLQQADPLARRPALEAERRSALLAGDDNEVSRLDAELLAMARDSERRELAIADLERQIAEAEAAERAAETDKLVRAAKSASKKIDAALAEYREGAMKVLGALEAIARIEDTVSKANAALAPDKQLPSAEMAVRGLPSEAREQLSRRGIGERWYFEDNGAPIAEGDVAKIKSDDGRIGTLDVHDRETGLLRSATVVKRRLVEITTLEGRPAYAPYALHGTVSLPGILPGHADFWSPSDHDVVLPKIAELKTLLGRQQAVDPRAGRERFTSLVVEDL
jgi:hypothetical protein